MDPTEQAFFKLYGDLHPFTVARTTKLIRANEITDVMSERIPEFVELGEEEGVLFFIDLSPFAEWSHPCEYVLLAEDGRLIGKARRDYPPRGNIQLTPVRAQ